MSSMPTNSKTWIHSTNNVVNTGVASTDFNLLMFIFVRFLVDAFGCSIARCSYWNGSAFAVADSDQWTTQTQAPMTISSLQTTARAWAVVKFPATFGGGNVSILFDFLRYNNPNYSTNVRMSYSGYALGTGSTTVLPTAASGTEVTLCTYSQNSTLSLFPVSTSKKIYNSAISSDGQTMNFFVFNESVCTSFFGMSKIKNPSPGLISDGKQDDFFVTWYGSGATPTDKMTYANLYTNSKSYIYGNIAASGNITFETGGECTAGSTTPATNQYTATANPQDGLRYPLLPISLWSSANNAYAYGRHGEVFDMWWATTPLAIGSTFPGDGSKTHIKIGAAVAIPWNGSVPVIA